jgi:hypothetical protein
MTDLRGYVNPFPPGALTEAGQRELMPDGAEIYVEDRNGRQIDALLASVRMGVVVAVADMYLLAPGALRPQKRRRLLGERIEAIQAKGGDILELATNYRASRRLPAMMLRAYERIASSGRAGIHNRPGRQPKWVLTVPERELIEGIWRSRKYKNDAERAVAIHRRSGKKPSRAWLRLHFGSPHGRDN